MRARDIREVREHRQSRGTGRSEDARHPGMRGIRGCGPKPDDPPAALPPKSKLACKLAYDLRLPPYAACLRLP